MELRRYLDLLVRWWWLMALTTVVCSGAMYLYSRTLPPTYRTTALLFVNQVSVPGTLTLSDMMLNQQLAKTFSRLLVQPVVLDEVHQRLNPPVSSAALGQMVSANPVRDTQLLEVTAEGADPLLVRDVANTLAEVFTTQQIAQLAPNSQGRAIHIAQPALVPSQPVGPRVMFNTAVAAVFGLLLGLGTIALREYLDDTVKTPDDLEQATSLATLGSVMRVSPRDGVHNVLLSPTRGSNPAFEAYRLVRTNLEFASIGERLVVLLVTSANPGEGKSTTVANLAMAVAQVGKQVIVVDADLRKPILHRLFEVPDHEGLTNLLLLEHADIEQHLKPGPVDGLRVLPAGMLPPNPAELLASPRMGALLEQLRGLADMVIIDSPPVLAVADAIVLAGRVDGTMLVVDSQRTRTEQLRRAHAALAKSSTRLLGAVINKLGDHAPGYYHYYGSEDNGHENGRRHRSAVLLDRMRKTARR